MLDVAPPCPVGKGIPGTLQMLPPWSCFTSIMDLSSSACGRGFLPLSSRRSFRRSSFSTSRILAP